MKKLFSALRVKTDPHQLFDLIASLIESQDLSTIRYVAENSFIAGDATITVKYFDDGAFEEVQISFGYVMGKGVTVVLRNYVEHLIVVNHEILESYHTIEFPIPTESFGLKEYRKQFDAIALTILKAVEGLEHA